MGESDKPPVKKPSDTAKPVPEAQKSPEAPKNNLVLLVLGCIIVGIVIGYVAYAVFAPQPQTTASQPNYSVTPIQVPQQNVAPTIQITVINDSRCPTCNSTDVLLSELMGYLPQQGFVITNVTVFDASTPEAAALISKYSLDETPTLIITGDTNASANLTSVWTTYNIGSIEPDGAMVYRNVIPPYYDLSSNKVAGIVNITELTAPSCVDCFNISTIVTSLSEDPQISMRIGNITSYSYNSSQGQALVAKYNITQVPTIILSPDAGVYSPLTRIWSNIGTVEADGFYVLRTGAPYLNLTSGSIMGHVSIIELTDLSCIDCYNVSTLYDMLEQQVGMVFTNTSTYDLNSTEGKQLVSKYNITSVPAIILSPSALAYPGFSNGWQSIGSVESDGWLVLRSVGSFGTYMNLTTGNVTAGTLPASATTGTETGG
jgi:hypothetical protein